MKILKKKQNRIKQNNNVNRKKLVSLALIALITVGAFAQNQKRGDRKSDLTPEQFAELQTKKMTLNLDLSEAQQKKVYDLNNEQAIKREAKRKEMMAQREKGEKPTGKNSFERKNSRLDAQMAHQNEMKKILNDKQFETWKNSRKHKAHKMKKRGKDKKMEQNSTGNKKQMKRGQGSKNK